nr:metallophosphoesterase [Clostridium thermarum]
MKIMFVADTESTYIWDYFQPEKFKDVDLIISCGDVKAEYLSFLVTMIKAPLFYIPGNHDDKYLKNPPEGCECIDGRMVVFKGIRILGLGGSQRYNLGHFQYTEKQMKRRVKKLKFKLWLNKGVDIVVTHAPLLGVGDGEDLCHRGFACFNELIKKYKPQYFIHGHQHLSYGYQPERIKKYEGTTVINAYDHYILEYK